MGVQLEKRGTSSEGIYECFDLEDGKLYAISDVHKFGANRFSYGAADTRKLQKMIGVTTNTSITELANQMVNQ